MRVYLSSSETGRNAETLCLVKKDMNLLTTFYYLKHKSDSKIKEFLEKMKKISPSLFLDSGAYTFLNEYKTKMGIGKMNPQAKVTATKLTPQQYFDKYVAFVKKYQQYFEYIVEFDIDALVGYEQVLKWRKELLAEIPAEKLIVVFHTTIPNCYAEWEKWCTSKEPWVLGIGGAAEGNIHRLGYMFKEALKYKKKVHGFAMTKNRYVIKYPWFSVDSSSWNIGQRFGTVLYFDPVDLGIHSFNLQRIYKEKGAYNKFLKDVFPKIQGYMQVSFEDLCTNRKYSNLIDVCNANAYIRQEIALTRLWEKRGVTFK